MRAWKIIILTGAVVISPALAKADDGLSRTEIDKRARMVAMDVVNAGANMFNAGDQQGCYRLYEGALWSLKPMLDHRPELIKMIEDGMAKANSQSAIGDKAFALREALDAVMADRQMMKPPSNGKKPLWDRLGGEAGVRAVTHDFIAMAAKDPKANLDRNGNYPLTKERSERVENLVIEFVSSVTGGPLKYTGRDMKNSHAGMKITETEFNTAAGYLIAALKKYNVPQPEIDELVGLVSGVAKDIIEVKK